MSDDSGERLDDAARAALERWQPPGAPADFADRLDVAAIGGGGDAGDGDHARARRRLRWPAVVALTAALAAAAAIAVVAWPSAGAPEHVLVASRSFAARETVELGGRGVAVAEPGAAFGWRKDGAALTVRQEAGDVFYRVDSSRPSRSSGRAASAPFVVTTPAGEIRVTGTCFRVEVLPMKPSRQSVLSAAAGAAIATAAVVTVYEGKVLVASPSGQAEVKAGEQVTLDSAPPVPATAAGPTVAVAVPTEPSPSITREELLVRDQAQREQIAALTGRLKELEAATAAGGGVIRRKGPRGHDGGEDWLNPTKEELLELAKECGVKLDLPPLARGEHMQIRPQTAEALGLTAAELAQANQAVDELRQSWTQRVRGWYVEATGDQNGADQLSVHSMAQELQDKAAPGEPEALRKRMSHERAGLIAPPTDLSRLSPFERYFRAFAAMGDETERVLAEKLGAEKAHAIRAENGGWGMRMSMSGCSDEGDEDVGVPRQ